MNSCTWLRILKSTECLIALLLLVNVFAFSSQSARAGQRLRVATYNTSMNRSSAGTLATELSSPGSLQPNRVAEVIQAVNPDVILINEFDYDATGQSGQDFITNYLNVSQAGLDAVDYPHIFNAASNTGIQPEDELGDPNFDFDFDNNGGFDDSNDAFGFGAFPGQFGMLMLSKYPIDTANARTFQKFLWKDMPGALLPDNLSTPGVPADWYSPEELNVFRLSSKSHWDVPVMVDGESIHLLNSHPTPPVFDGAEDRNGLRNHDEIRFWADYIDPNLGAYIYDDQEFASAGNQTPGSPNGGLPANESFVILGDLNADIDEGDSSNNAAQQLTSNPLINNSFVPTGVGGIEPDDTATFSGHVRVDYVLPSIDLTVVDDADKTGVFWPLITDPHGIAANASSDHRLVFVDFIIGVLGDLNNDLVVDAADIDQLYESGSETNLNKFDLDENGVIDPNDVAYQVQTILGTEFGDTDLDGDVDGIDFLAVQQGFGSDSGWAGGDFDGSGLVDSADINILLANYGFVSQSVAVASVPEPSIIGLCAYGLLTLFHFRSRSQDLAR